MLLIWLDAACSVSLETNVKLLIGCKFINADSAPGFLKRGWTSANFQGSGNIFNSSDKLIILEMLGRRTSEHFITRGVGMRWIEHDFLLDSAIISPTSFISSLQFICNLFARIFTFTACPPKETLHCLIYNILKKLLKLLHL